MPSFGPGTVDPASLCAGTVVGTNLLWKLGHHTQYAFFELSHKTEKGNWIPPARSSSWWSVPGRGGSSAPSASAPSSGQGAPSQGGHYAGDRASERGRARAPALVPQFRECGGQPDDETPMEGGPKNEVERTLRHKRRVTDAASYRPFHSRTAADERAPVPSAHACTCSSGDNTLASESRRRLGPVVVWRPASTGAGVGGRIQPQGGRHPHNQSQAALLSEKKRQVPSGLARSRKTKTSPSGRRRQRRQVPSG